MRIQYRGLADERVINRSDVESLSLGELPEEFESATWSKANHFIVDIPEELAQWLRANERADWVVEQDIVEPPPEEEEAEIAEVEESSAEGSATPGGDNVKATGPAESTGDAASVPESGVSPSRTRRSTPR